MAISARGRSALLVCLLVAVAAGSRLPSMEDFEELRIRAQLRSDDNPEADMTTPELIEKNGYPVETHKVTTQDGYILTMHRIPGGRGNSTKTTRDGSKKPVVFLQHCLLCSSAVWVLMGPDKGLGYILADAGFDVWMGNARGNEYSRDHSWLNPDKPRFWDFSWHEMGIYDLPAEFDYILQETGQENLSYVGHSMGTTMFFVMSIARPEYNDKVKVMHALAPVVYMGRIKSPIRLLAPFLANADWLAKLLGMNEFSPSTEFLTFVGKAGCNDEAVSQDLCSNVLYLLSGYDTDQLNTTTLPVILGHIPAGTSTKTVIHYAQGVKSGDFRMYDYGLIENLKRYGKKDPPAYDLDKVTAPVILHYATNDWLSDVKDVEDLSQKLPNVAGKFLVPYERFSHLDYLFAIDINDLLYDKLVELLKE